MNRCPIVGPRDRGQALTELALVLPILLILLIGTIDVGRMLFASVAMEEAAQEGALYAAFEPSPSPTLEEAVRARVRSSSDAAEVAGATVTASCAPSPSPGAITVTAEYDYPLITPIADMLGTTVRIGASVTAPDVKGTC
jgi:Flp pilus assembly protein TadG